MGEQMEVFIATGLVEDRIRQKMYASQRNSVARQERHHHDLVRAVVSGDLSIIVVHVQVIIASSEGGRHELAA